MKNRTVVTSLRRFWLVGLVAAHFALIPGCSDSGFGDAEPEPDAIPEPAPDDEQFITRVFAAAGADRGVLEGSRVFLDGSASRALDGSLTLTWSQTGGEPVLLTNPSGQQPAFVAPLADDTLTFQLRAQSGYDYNIDTVTISVGSAVSTRPFYLSVPPDSTAQPGEIVTFDASLVVAPAEPVTFSAEALCEATATASVDGEIEVELFEALPCAVAVHAETDDGVRSVRAVHVIWPEGTPLPPPTELIQSPTLLLPGQVSTLRYDAARLAAVGASPRTWTTGELLSLDAFVTTPEVEFTVPARQGRIAFGTEVRRGAASGGVRYVLAQVSAGTGNRTPVANAGPSREVQPGGSFAIDTSGSIDLDGDPLTIRTIQVLGQAAVADASVPNTFQAPDTEGVMLFHVIANDGVVDSAPSPVRVTVSAAAENTPPVLTLDPIRYVQPGVAFTLDASGATDNSGLIASYSISQEPGDVTLLLPEAVETSTVVLTAGSEGDVYRFRLSAFDVEGLRGVADVEVRVESAGPYVDPVRGSPDGDGTIAAPFATLAAAVDVATRHRLEELRLVQGPHAPWTGDYPAGLSLRGGYTYEGAEYLPPTPEVAPVSPTMVPVGDSGLSFTGSGVSDVTLSLTDPNTTVEPRGTNVFERVTITESALHAGPLLTVQAHAALTFVDGTIAPVAEGDVIEGAAIVIEDDASVEFLDATITAGTGGAREAILCRDAQVSVSGGRIVGGHDATSAIGIRGTDCTLELLGATVVGGDGSPTATALDLLRTVLFVDAASIVAGVQDDGDEIANPVPVSSSIALRFRGSAAGIVQGLLTTHDAIEVPTSATALVSETASLSLDGATLDAFGLQTAVAADVRAANFQAAGTMFGAEVSDREDVDARSVAVRLSGTNLQLDTCTLSAVGGNARGIEGDTATSNNNARLLLSLVSVDGNRSAAGVALANSSGILVSGSVLVVTGEGDANPVLGLSALQATVRNSVVNTSAPGDVAGLVLGIGPSDNVVERALVRVGSVDAGATALLSNGGLNLKSSALFADGRTPDSQAIALDARGVLRLVHGTLVANDIALALDNAGAAITLANSAFAAPTAITTTETVAFPADSLALAFDAGILLARDSGNAEDLPALEEVGCNACLTFIRENAIDENARLLVGANPLVDAAAPALADALDIDGDTRPQGTAPDIGCDERVDP